MKILLPTALRGLCLGLCLLFGGCAGAPALQDVRDFAAESSSLSGYAELSQRFRDTYPREQPYLSAAADQRERVLDSVRRQQYADALNIEKSVKLYLDVLAALAGEGQYDLTDEVKGLGSAIKAWPDTGIEDSHVNAYTQMASLLARTLGAPRQQRAVQTMVRDGRQPLQQLLAAMAALLRYYDKSNANERNLVLGVFEVEIPFADTAPNRLLTTLAKAQQQSKAAEYRLAERDYRLAEHNLAVIAQAQQALAQLLAQPDDAAARGALQAASRQLRLNRAALHVSLRAAEPIP
ncbi:hypothetical protein [Rugamonas sp.]|uniref:hypothetical protein n=1 Tax=Rugamonas sp. TaxID=1926287 RepID=UPI0025F7C6BF|nr:hypothetical protein [Rugamonas sp.]